MKCHDDALIRLFHVYKRYGAKNALFDISLDIFKNEFLFLTGPSGAGKSTLLKLLYLGESLSEGQILIDRMNLARVSRKRAPELRRKLGIIFQDYKLIPTKTVYENVSLVLEARGMSHKFIQKKVHSVLRTVGMEKRKKSFPPGLSGGEQQKVAVARAVVGEPKIILADEPTGSLDADSAGTIFDLLTNIHARGATVLVATHDAELIRSAKGRVIQLKEGKVVAE
ncbi:MAG: cell division ATP-binding protein FtsE [Deltaproteobacteria bacterium]|nr:cell division ATP-binding protein FtsE [Deltaproteobacteria bacterium]MBW2611136.1 cell division ATP-binding protein FtsE [Deltaproteobacteria bacterium]MBW2632979.1 cell division ATP-binding protein FtsE [Deltaproteobacteria bacterium]MBW2678776.1 cell division ATP-binding protein FtsE [Deltaproteobacteria bacterium]